MSGLAPLMLRETTLSNTFIKYQGISEWETVNGVDNGEMQLAAPLVRRLRHEQYVRQGRDCLQHVLGWTCQRTGCTGH
jgi:hypothetical protein